MNRLVRIFLLVAMLLGAACSSRASHIFGGELLYTHISGDLYKLTLTLYGDCRSLAVAGSNSAFADLPYSAPLIRITDGTSVYRDTFALHLEPGSGIEVSPVCPGQLSNTYCNGGSLPGVKQFIYSDTIRLYPSAKWKFVFSGSLGSGRPSAGRAETITNVYTGTYMSIRASMNNLAAANSSPVFSTIPTPFYCINILQQYNQGATDSDGDSLSFSLVPAVDGLYGTNVSYVYLYSGTHPLATAPGNFSFSSLNGQITFTPNMLQKSLVVNQVNEYRHGVLVGTSQREMTFIVQDNCDGVPPVASVNSVSGAVLTSGNIFNICQGQPNVSFNVGLANPEGDITDITPVNVPASATLVVSNNHTAAPSVSFSWPTGSLPLGHYTFYLTIKSNHCPSVNTQTVAYTINVSSPPTIEQKQISITNCVNPAAMQYTLHNGFAPRNVIIMQGSTIIKTLTDTTTSDTTGVVIDSLPAGTYTAIVRSDALCVDSISFTIADSGVLPVAPVAISMCRGDGALPIVIPLIKPGATINWFNPDGTALPSAPIVNTYSVGVYNWYFVEDYNVCTSGPVAVTATVHQLPHVEILNIPQTVCYGDEIYLQATGGISYTWEPADIIKKDTGGQYIQVLLPVTVVVHGKDEFGCIDTASVTYSDIQQCCRFSYPNAFTPNNDGNNDGFRIVTWGNMRQYALTIYNRWGQPVFFTADPDKPWDGTFHGQPCEIGTYYYYMQGECLTGPKESHKGDVILVR